MALNLDDMVTMDCSLVFASLMLLLHTEDEMMLLMHTEDEMMLLMHTEDEMMCPMLSMINSTHDK